MSFSTSALLLVHKFNQKQVLIGPREAEGKNYAPGAWSEWAVKLQVEATLDIQQYLRYVY